MTYSVEQIKKYRTRFGWVFLVSFLILTVFSFFELMLSEPLMPDESQAPQSVPNGRIEPASGSTITLLIAVVSLLTSVTSLLGFVFTTVVAWRKERRERQHSDLDLEKKRLEVERLRQELVRGRNEDGQER